MSFIQNTIQCFECKKWMNVSTGTFGGGIPKDCPFCKRYLVHHESLSGWQANADGSLKKDIKLTAGEELLIRHLQEVLMDAEAGEFGDFTNEKYPTPKITLRGKLLEMADNVEKGIYD